MNRKCGVLHLWLLPTMVICQQGNLPAHPPTIIFHGTADHTVPYSIWSVEGHFIMI
jgi:hypothetical protein